MHVWGGTVYRTGNTLFSHVTKGQPMVPVVWWEAVTVWVHLLSVTYLMFVAQGIAAAVTDGDKEPRVPPCLEQHLALCPQAFEAD